MDKLK
ncbi:hypothetical protein BpHYR1_045326 [Brachionus plicatilis]|jgi:hypothetical protein